MTLAAACDIGDACGLSTVAEAVWYADHMAMSLFVYGEIGAELTELYTDFLELPNQDMLIVDYLSQVNGGE